MSNYLGRKLQRLYPGSVPQRDWILALDGDNYSIPFWNIDGVPKPTIEEIDTSIEDVEIEKVSKLSEITNKRNEALANLTTTWDGDAWDADEDTSNRIANALSMVREASSLGIPTPPAIPWRTYDNKDRILTIAELTQMGAAVFLAQQEVWGKQAQLKNAIEAATTVEELDGIRW